MRLKVIILVIALLFTGGVSEIFLTPSNAQAAELCTPAQKESAKKAQDMLQTFAKREEVGVSVYYEWFEPWYSLSYHQQLQLIRAAADTETCLSNGKISAIFFEYGGEKVAQARFGKVEVLKSQP